MIGSTASELSEIEGMRIGFVSYIDQSLEVSCPYGRIYKFEATPLAEDNSWSEKNL